MLTWEPAIHALGVAEMDGTHEEFIRELDHIQRAADADFPRLFEALGVHLQEHFDNESRLMRACGFGPIAIHEAEHRRVLGEVALIGRGVARGQLGLARAYVAVGVVDWFHNHLATMDGALAACLKARKIAA
ncbi:MAG TPA: hemerythrin domain-containing protein [Rhodocyclaceae bacterium]